MKYSYNRRVLMALCAASGTLMLTGFTSLAAEPGQGILESRALIERTAVLSAQASVQLEESGMGTAAYPGEDAGADNGIISEWELAEITGAVQADAVEAVRTAAEKAQAAYEAKLEEERKAEEARKTEEARRLAEEQAAAAEAAAAQEAQSAAVSAAEQELLAALIFCEAGNQPYEGQVAVGAVVMNRVKSGVYPNTITDVIYQSGQFTPAMTGWLDSVLASSGYTDSARQAAADAIAGSNPVGECLYFSTGGYGMQIGDHYFH